MSVRIKDLPEKTADFFDGIHVATETASDESNKTKRFDLDKIPRAKFYSWGASDEDSPLSTGDLYVTESAIKSIKFIAIAFSLKNAPTGSTMTFDALLEDAVDSNTFTSMFSVKPTIDINKFQSTTSLIQGTLNTDTWIVNRRILIRLITNDSNFAATGVKMLMEIS